MSPILAIDLGGTRLRAGLADPASPADVVPLGEWLAPTDLAGFTERIASLLREHRSNRLGLGIPGLARGTTCVWVPNLPFLDGSDLSLLFPGRITALGNDAHFALLAEVMAGSAKGLSDAILLAVGTGIGSAVLSGGRIVRGASGGACSFGWASADLADPGEDRSGWLERHASGRTLDQVASHLGLQSGSVLIEKAREGDEAALAALAPPMAALGTALAGAVALLDPQAIILAGGVAASSDVLAPLVLPSLRRHLPPHLRGIGIKAGVFGPKAGLIGAAFAGSLGQAWEKVHG